MDIYVPNKNLYDDCLAIIAIAKQVQGIIGNNSRVFVLKNMFYHNKIRNYRYTHNFHKYFRLNNYSFIDDTEKDEFIHSIYTDLNKRELMFQQKITYNNKLLLNRHHFRYIDTKYVPYYLYDIKPSMLLLAALQEVQLVDDIDNIIQYNIPSNFDTDILYDRIGIYVCFDDYDKIKSVNNSFVLSFLEKCKDKKLFIASDNYSKLPMLHKSNDVVFFDTSRILRSFISNADNKQTEKMLDDTFTSAWLICHCNEVIGSNNNFSLVFLNFLRAKLKKPSVRVNP